MKAPAAPTPPDPAVTAGAQTANNIGTAIANANLQSVDQVTPYGNLTFDQTDTFEYTDPNTGEVHNIPRFTATQSLSPEMQGIFDSQTAAQGNMASLAADSSARLNEYMAQGLDTGSLPQGGSASNISLPNLTMSVEDRTGDLQRSVGGQSYQTEFGNAGDITRSYGTDFSEDRQKVEDALMSRMNPSLERDRESLRTRLVGQGIREGSEAFDRAMNRFGEQSNDARMQAVLAGGQEQSRLVGLERDRASFQNAAQAQDYSQQKGRADFANSAKQQQFGTDLAQGTFANTTTGQATSMDLARGEFGNAAQQQQFSNQMALEARKDGDRSTALQETLTLRNQPINEIGALLGTGQVTQPNFVNPNIGAIAGTDRAGIENANYNARLGAWQQQNASRSALLGGLLGAGGMLGAAKLSDRRTKTDIEQVGEYGSLNVYRFKYRGQDTEQVGFMADEVMQIAPEAIVYLPGGVMAVNYDLAMEAA
ncbi:MAG: tail fiber domain-containing protein [Sulfitobacter sp.]|nr:tail fiber domain-containing protein [Sulfitobacter sp.]